MPKPLPTLQFPDKALEQIEMLIEEICVTSVPLWGEPSGLYGGKCLLKVKYGCFVYNNQLLNKTVLFLL